MDYKRKYLKYKLKYLNEKKFIMEGGGKNDKTKQVAAPEEGAPEETELVVAKCIKDTSDLPYKLDKRAVAKMCYEEKLRELIIDRENANAALKDIIHEKNYIEMEYKISKLELKIRKLAIKMESLYKNSRKEPEEATAVEREEATAAEAAEAAPVDTDTMEIAETKEPLDYMKEILESIAFKFTLAEEYKEFIKGYEQEGKANPMKDNEMESMMDNIKGKTEEIKKLGKNLEQMEDASYLFMKKINSELDDYDKEQAKRKKLNSERIRAYKAYVEAMETYKPGQNVENTMNSYFLGVLTLSKRTEEAQRKLFKTHANPLVEEDLKTINSLLVEYFNNNETYNKEKFEPIAMTIDKTHNGFFDYYQMKDFELIDKNKFKGLLTNYFFGAYYNLVILEVELNEHLQNLEKDIGKIKKLIKELIKESGKEEEIRVAKEAEEALLNEEEAAAEEKAAAAKKRKDKAEAKETESDETEADETEAERRRIEAEKASAAAAAAAAAAAEEERIRKTAAEMDVTEEEFIKIERRDKLAISTEKRLRENLKDIKKETPIVDRIVFYRSIIEVYKKEYQEDSMEIEQQLGGIIRRVGGEGGVKPSPITLYNSIIMYDKIKEETFSETLKVGGGNLTHDTSDRKRIYFRLPVDVFPNKTHIHFDIDIRPENDYGTLGHLKLTLTFCRAAPKKELFKEEIDELYKKTVIDRYNNRTEIVHNYYLSNQAGEGGGQEYHINVDLKQVTFFGNGSLDYLEYLEYLRNIAILHLEFLETLSVLMKPS